LLDIIFTTIISYKASSRLGNARKQRRRFEKQYNQPLIIGSAKAEETKRKKKRISLQDLNQGRSTLTALLGLNELLSYKQISPETIKTALKPMQG